MRVFSHGNRIVILAIFILGSFAPRDIFAQTKGSQQRPSFERGSNHRLSGSLRPAGEKEFAFTAQAGTTLEIDNRANAGFDVRIYGPKGEFDTEFDSTPQFDVELPFSGDYYLIVRRKVSRRTKPVRFTVLVTIR